MFFSNFGDQEAKPVSCCNVLTSKHPFTFVRHFSPSFPRPKHLFHGFHNRQSYPQGQKSPCQRECDRALAAHMATRDLDKSKQAGTADTEAAGTADPHPSSNQADPAVPVLVPQDLAAPAARLPHTKGASSAPSPIKNTILTN